ncbi:integron gene cassette protein [Drechmeria coniospora]|uniref:Integron gene cassette protein n=1 Tax=Drechmeria coniospora TaxID=98403 RepID=A0A151GUN0_DRECN|nr:integron gene cassette protein [Drechmeria coniospora]KYK60815.1 integron gene cassette protein [Drechmeria coniospora]ODA83510.1 hypothetical protein RJ55_02024 [Drechmeria coniospora]
MAAPMNPPLEDPGEASLSKLLANLTATLHPTTYVFATVVDVAQLPPLENIQLLFRESEGITVVTSMDYVTEHQMDYFFPCKMITLDVTSSLEAVGFMAVLATRLAAKNIGVNPVSAFYHDHLFVSLGSEKEAMDVLSTVAEENKKATDDE